MARQPYQVLVYLYRLSESGAHVYAIFRRADDGNWQAVAGGGEDGETPLESARRETLEETGLSPEMPFLQLQTIEPIPVTEFKDSPLWGEDLYVIPQYCFGVPAPAGEVRLSHEHTQVRWLTFAEAWPRLKYEGNRTALWELECRLRGEGPRRGPKPGQSPAPIPGLLFIKLGGSLITDKAQPHTPRPEALRRLADEITAAFEAQPGLRLVLGHGSGSFGHVAGAKHGTRQGVRTDAQWRGFAEVWQEARALNQMVMETLAAAGLPAMAFPPSAAVTARDGQIAAWDIAPLRAALERGLLPVVYGDVAFDTIRGGTILSTEDLFDHLAHILCPRRILLAGLEPGVWADYPACTRLVEQITPDRLGQIAAGLGGSHAADVTGGMESKVRQALGLVQAIPGLEVLIFSGDQPGNVQRALLGERIGTLVALRPA